MARNHKNKSNRPYRHVEYRKMRARTERLNAGVRLASCVVALVASLAVLAGALKPYRVLQKMRADLAEVKEQEMQVLEREDAKKREYKAIETDPKYLEIIARDRLNYYKEGEFVFRIER